MITISESALGALQSFAAASRQTIIHGVLCSFDPRTPHSADRTFLRESISIVPSSPRGLARAATGNSRLFDPTQRRPAS